MILGTIIYSLIITGAFLWMVIRWQEQSRRERDLKNRESALEDWEKKLGG